MDKAKKITLKELEKAIKKAEITELERDDDNKYFHVELSELLGVDFDTFATSESDARKKALEFFKSNDSDLYVLVDEKEK